MKARHSFKSILSLVLVVSMVALMLTACGTQAPPAAEAPVEDVPAEEAAEPSYTFTLTLEGDYPQLVLKDLQANTESITTITFNTTPPIPSTSIRKRATIWRSV